MTVLLTGATGFVGAEVLARLLARGEDVVALARRPDAAAALEAAGARTVLGDLRDAALELPRADTVVHCAASVSFGLPLAQARRINVAGTRAVVAHAARTGARLVHVSTAFVAGRHRGVFREGDADCGQAFRNTYEQSKLEAETLVRGSGVEHAVLRPSIVVGDSRTGRTTSFNVLYWPLRAFSRGLLPAVPARADGRVDVVPVDYVADAIVHVAGDATVGGTLHLVAGEEAATVDELVTLACDAFGRERPRIVAPVESTGLAERSPEAAQYLPYFDMEVVFGDERARSVLRPAGLAPPPLRSYFPSLVAYAEATRWGKRAVAA
ncbi:MAG TPA: SDR family oxidoreductase [Solirubrobacteraceae bacterium]|nr:SDR family oxidoreductase [Solirubrobacteraceae bacterium]